MSNVSDFELYDAAVYKYLAEIVPRVVYAPTDRAYYTLVKKSPEFKDKIPYKFISFYRDPSIPIDHDRYSDQAIIGDRVQVMSSTPDKIVTKRYVHSIPVTLTYQVDIWGVKETEVLRMSQSLLTKLTMRNPVLFVPINPDGEMGRFHILDVSLVNNSDVESEESNGKVYRHTYSFTINAWIKYVEDVESTQWECPEVVITDDLSIYD